MRQLLVLSLVIEICITNNCRMLYWLFLYKFIFACINEVLAFLQNGTLNAKLIKELFGLVADAA